jgi:hypothetical protein
MKIILFLITFLVLLVAIYCLVKQVEQDKKENFIAYMTVNQLMKEGKILSLDEKAPAKNNNNNNNNNNKVGEITETGPKEWYNFKNYGYSYHDPKYWGIPQKYQPVCYDKDDTSPAPLFSGNIDGYLFYQPLQGDKYTNEEMRFEIKPKIFRTRLTENQSGSAAGDLS